MDTPYQNRCVLGIDGLTNTAFGVEVERIQTCLENPVFLTLTPSPAEVRVVLNEFTAAQQECSGRNYKMIPTRDAKRKQLSKMMRIQCDGVNYISQGDETILQLSGFDLMRAPQHPSVPAAGLITKAEPTAEIGSFKVTCTGVRPVKYYEFESRGEDGVAHYHLSNHNNVIIDSYPTGERVELRVRASNSAGKGFWSAPFVYRVPFDVAKPKPSASTGTDDPNMKVA
jgi:hypothetical protein